APHARVVRLRHRVRRVGEALAEPVVVREDEQARRVAVQAPDREDPAADIGEEFVHRRTSTGVLARRHVADRLVEDEPRALRGVADRSAVHRDSVTGGVEPLRGVADDLAAESDAAFADQDFGLLAGRCAEFGQGPGQGDLCGLDMEYGLGWLRRLLGWGA